MNHKHVLNILAGIESVFYALFIWVVMSAQFAPDDRYDVAEAIRSTSLVGIVAVAWMIFHASLQIIMAVNRPTDVKKAAKVYDFVTSLLPFIAMVGMTFYEWGKHPVAWWGTWVTFFFLTIIVSVAVDIVFTVLWLRKTRLKVKVEKIPQPVP